jgi:hypothetical protein
MKNTIEITQNKFLNNLPKRVFNFLDIFIKQSNAKNIQKIKILKLDKEEREQERLVFKVLLKSGKTGVINGWNINDLNGADYKIPCEIKGELGYE